MTIDEFIEVYTPIELDKVDKAMNKTVSPEDRRSMGRLVTMAASSSEESSPRRRASDKSGFTALLGLRKGSSSPTKQGTSPTALRHSSTLAL